MTAPDWKSRWFVTALLVTGGVLIAYLCFRIFQPFFGPVVWATVLAVLLRRGYRRLALWIRNRSVAAFAMCVAAALLVGVPFFYLIATLPGQLAQAYQRVEQLVVGDQGADPRLMHLWNRASEMAAEAGYDLKSAVRTFLSQGASRIVALAPKVIGQAFGYGMDFALIFFTLFFFLRDGNKVLYWLRGLLPLSRDQTNELFTKVRDVMRATVFGGFAVAFAQGGLGGLLFWAVGLPTPVLWGALMAVLSMLPPLGAWLVWVPAGLILLTQDEIIKGLILLGGGALAVSLVDNIMRPMIIGQRTRLPTLLIFFSLLGGLQVFGAVGLIAGPVLVALFIGILDFTRDRIQRLTGASPEGAASGL